MAEKKLSNPVNMIIIVAFVAIIAILITSFGNNLQNNPNAKLSDKSNSYIDNLEGTDTKAGLNISQVNSEYTKDALDDDEAENKYDFALDFVFGKKKANTLSRFAYILLSVPEWVTGDVFGFGLNGWQDLLDVLDWLWRIFIFVAIIHFIRGKQ